MHSILTGHPRFKQVVDELADLDHKQRADQARVEARDRRHMEALEVWRQASAEAALLGKEPPPAPVEPPPLANNTPYFAQRQRELTEERERLKRELAPEVEAQLYSREEELFTAGTTTTVADLPPLVEELNLLLETARVVRFAVDPRPGSRADRTRGGVTEGDFVDALVHDWSLLEPGPEDPRARPQSRIMRADVDPEVAARARLQQQPSEELRLAFAKYQADLARGNRPRPSMRRG